MYYEGRKWGATHFKMTNMHQKYCMGHIFKSRKWKEGCELTISLRKTERHTLENETHAPKILHGSYFQACSAPFFSKKWAARIPLVTFFPIFTQKNGVRIFFHPFLPSIFHANMKFGLRKSPHEDIFARKYEVRAHNRQIIALHKFFHPFVPSIFPAYMKISLPKKSPMRILLLANIE